MKLHEITEQKLEELGLTELDYLINKAWAIHQRTRIPDGRRNLKPSYSCFPGCPTLPEKYSRHTEEFIKWREIQTKEYIKWRDEHLDKGEVYGECDGRTNVGKSYPGR